MSLVSRIIVEPAENNRRISYLSSEIFTNIIFEVLSKNLIRRMSRAEAITSRYSENFRNNCQSFER